VRNEIALVAIERDYQCTCGKAFTLRASAMKHSVAISKSPLADALIATLNVAFELLLRISLRAHHTRGFG
jgi:hypothetical protein